MGLNHPESMDMWRDWQRSRQKARRAKHAVVGGFRDAGRRGRAGSASADGAERGPQWSLLSRDGERESRVLLAVDSASPTSRASVLSFLPYLRAGVDVLAPADVELPELTGDEWERRTDPDAAMLIRDAAPDAVLSLGHHLGGGEAAHAYALTAGIPQYVVQHGALTPFAPPLPREATLLAWSDEDAAFFTEHRDDVEPVTVGSQLLWQAAHEGSDVDTDATPVFLGQMHGAELPRRLTAGAAYRFCRENGAEYRPHPAETDVLSRTAHGLFQRRGIAFADTSVPLREVASPVVGIFSTGVLEAAVRGVPAWVYCPGAPMWVLEFWHRYRMSRWGSSQPTVGPPLSPDEPARLIAQLLEEAV